MRVRDLIHECLLSEVIIQAATYILHGFALHLLLCLLAPSYVAFFAKAPRIHTNFLRHFLPPSFNKNPPYCTAPLILHATTHEGVHTNWILVVRLVPKGRSKGIDLWHCHTTLLPPNSALRPSLKAGCYLGRSVSSIACSFSSVVYTQTFFFEMEYFSAESSVF